MYLKNDTILHYLKQLFSGLTLYNGLYYEGGGKPGLMHFKNQIQPV